MSRASRQNVPRLLVDAAIVLLAYLTTLVLRFEGEVEAEYWRSFWRFVPFVLAVHLASNYGFGFYRLPASSSWSIAIAGAIAGVVIVTIGGWAWPGRPVPLSVLVFGAVVASLGFGATRLIRRTHGPLAPPGPPRSGFGRISFPDRAAVRRFVPAIGPPLLAAVLGVTVMVAVVALFQRVTP